jgi:hypothetical protein
MLSMEVDGMDELQAKLAELADIFSGPEAKEAYMDGAHVLLEEFRATAPVVTGRFRRSGFIERGSPDKPDVLFLIDYSVCRYAHIVEYGSVKEAPHATIRRAVESSGPEVAQVIEDGLARMFESKL